MALMHYLESLEYLNKMEKGPGSRILITIENMAGIPVSVPDRVHNMSTRSST